MNAARSVQGQLFVAKHCDIAFVRDNDRASLESQIGAYRQQARDLSGREIQMWCNCFVVQRDSRAAAEKYLDRVVEEYGDDGYLDTFIRIANPSVNDLPPAQRDVMRKNLKRVVGGEQLIGERAGHRRRDSPPVGERYRRNSAELGRSARARSRASMTRWFRSSSRRACERRLANLPRCKHDYAVPPVRSLSRSLGSPGNGNSRRSASGNQPAVQ